MNLVDIDAKTAQSYDSQLIQIAKDLEMDQWSISMTRRRLREPETNANMTTVFKKMIEDTKAQSRHLIEERDQINTIYNESPWNRYYAQPIGRSFRLHRSTCSKFSPLTDHNSHLLIAPHYSGLDIVQAKAKARRRKDNVCHTCIGQAANQS